MQTFLPYSDFVKSARVLDYKRLGKQRVEGMQIINAIENPNKQGWQNHPITVMWRPHIELLKHYTNIMITEWIDRGYNNTMKHYEVEWPINLPDWLGYKPFHSSHRANLLRKDYEYYSQFNWKENPESPYVWRDKDKLWYEQMVNTGERIYL
tara:strand:+ start:335 stop:790 length:456 start_codon:yes stop_codon:yes gene_type:complete